MTNHQLLASLDTEIVDLGVVEPGSVVTIRGDHIDKPDLHHIRRVLVDAVGHDRWALIVLGDNDWVQVVAPEGLREVLAVMSAAQLAQLADSEA